MAYKILYVKIEEAMSRGGLVFNSQLEAEDAAKKANAECPGFHCWAEPLPEPQGVPTTPGNPSPYRARMNAQGKLTATQREMIRLRAEGKI